MCTGVGLLDRMVALFSIFWGASILFSIAASLINLRRLEPYPCFTGSPSKIFLALHKVYAPQKLKNQGHRRRRLSLSSNFSGSGRQRAWAYPRLPPWIPMSDENGQWSKIEIGGWVPWSKGSIWVWGVQGSRQGHSQASRQILSGLRVVGTLVIKQISLLVSVAALFNQAETSSRSLSLFFFKFVFWGFVFIFSLPWNSIQWFSSSSTRFDNTR